MSTKRKSPGQPRKDFDGKPRKFNGNKSGPGRARKDNPPAQVRQYGVDDGDGVVWMPTRQDAANVVNMWNRGKAPDADRFAVIYSQADIRKRRTDRVWLEANEGF